MSTLDLIHSSNDGGSESTEASAVYPKTGLPNTHYTDHGTWQQERDRVVAKTWAGLGFGADIQEAGCVFPVNFMGLPLLMVRDTEGVARVFHNVCSHRGMTLVAEKGSAGMVIRCPYHRWGYGLSGELKATPNIGGMGVHSIEGFDCSEHGLKEVRSEELMGIVFINLSGEAPALSEHLDPILTRWGALAGKDFTNRLVSDTGPYGSMELSVESNYKLAIENYCESYHLPFVHPDLNTYSPLDEHYNLIVDPISSGQGTHVYDLTRGASTPLPIFANWDKSRVKTAEYLSLYPNVLLGIQADHFFGILLMPESPETTIERLQFLYSSEEALTDAYAERRQSLHEAWNLVFSEDVSVVEGMQRGRASPGFTGGVFSPLMDIPTAHFHGWFAKKYIA